MRVFIQIFLILFSTFCFGQKDTNWYAFYNSDSTKIGFKDAEGKIRIEPKFEQAMMSTDVFKEVIAVWNYGENYSGEQYYLNKNGRKFGKDSLYVFDFSFVKESEGKIKFRDTKTDKVGFFDKNGKVVIPAMYNDAEDFSNGIAIVIKGAHKQSWKSEGEKHEGGCDHWSWSGGKTLAISTNNKELFEIHDYNDYSYSIDYSQFKLNEKVDPEIYTSYKATDGNTYSFYSPEKDFNKWFETVFLPDFKKNKTVLPQYFYELISVDDNDNPQYQTAWKNHHKIEYLKKNQKSIDEVFNLLISGIYHKSVSWETLSNHSYFPENELPKDDLRNNTVISFYCRAENDYSATNSFQFTKIGDSFYITSAP